MSVTKIFNNLFLLIGFLFILFSLKKNHHIESIVAKGVALGLQWDVISVPRLQPLYKRKIVNLKTIVNFALIMEKPKYIPCALLLHPKVNDQHK